MLRDALAEPLAGFHPLVTRWFAARHGAPTDVQARCWPRIRAGAHVLATAPTGSGKTLGAFLWALDRLASGAWHPGTPRVLYVSPLKALNNDIQRNLLVPLAELEAAFAASGESLPRIEVATRSGDTPSAARRRMQREPPAVLITTPESLNLMLSSPGGRGLLSGLETVILDEIHAVAGNRRGVYLMSAVERLTDLAGEFQRIALSATVKPLEGVARFVGGHAADTDGEPRSLPRPVTRLAAGAEQPLALRVAAAEPVVRPEGAGLDMLGGIAAALARRIRTQRATLVFANSRRLCERLAFHINECAGETLAWAHHGSLARELRLDVEGRLKRGELRAIVATSSLELGIDIGELDEVVLVQAPPSITATIQRAGRAGHGVGETSHATFYPTHPHDLLQCAEAARAAIERDVEPLQPLVGCLDVLAQVLVSMAAEQPWADDALYAAARRVSAWHALERALFDRVVAMLTGRYADAQLGELRPRLLRQPDDGRLGARRGAVLELYRSGGVIPDRGYYQLRHAETGARLGELDEEFVWESRIGHVLSMGSQQWRIQRVTHSDVLVLPAAAGGQAPPFWRAEEIDREAHFARRIATLLETCEDYAAQGEAALKCWLASNDWLEPRAADWLAEHLSRQRSVTGAPLPHAGHLLLESVASGPAGYRGGDGTAQLILHTFWGGRINRPFALALEGAWREHFGQTPTIHVANDAIVVQVAGDAAPQAMLELVTADNAERLVRAGLEQTALFGARFRECAGRALLLSRGRFGERRPLWMTRLQAQRLLEGVRAYRDFPITLEAWRTCLVDEFDVDGLVERLTALEQGELAVRSVATETPSPFAAHLAWSQINQSIYADDTPHAQTTRMAELDSKLIDAVVRDAAQRPLISRDVVDDYVRRRHRLVAGYAPQDSAELVDWITERRLLTRSEWDALAATIRASAVGRQGRDPDATAALDQAAPHLVELASDGQVWITSRDGLVALERVAGAALTATASSHGSGDADAGAPVEALADWLNAWLAGHGPLALPLAGHWLPIAAQALEPALARLIEDERVIRGQLTEDAVGEQVCTASNVDTLLRRQRAARRSPLEPLPGERVSQYRAAWQGIAGAWPVSDETQRRDAATLADAVDPLRGLPLPCAMLEAEILATRAPQARPGDLDDTLARGELLWFGTGERRVVLCPPEDLAELPRPDDDGADALAAALFPDPQARYPWPAIVERGEGPPAQTAEQLWRAVWGGRASADSFEPVRRGLALGFRLSERTAPSGATTPQPQGRRAHARAGRRRVQQRTEGFPGNWHALAAPTHPDAALEAAELARSRARVLLDRHGVVCRAMLEHEPSGLRWRDVFPALRLMELAGEVTSGQLIAGVEGPQFATRQALQLIERMRGTPQASCWWLGACDPASPCALAIPKPPGLALPARRLGNQLLFSGARVVAVSEAWGRRLTFEPASDAPLLEPVLATLARMLAAPARTRRPYRVEQINAQPAPRSPYLAALRRHFETAADHRSVELSLPR